MGRESIHFYEGNLFLTYQSSLYMVQAMPERDICSKMQAYLVNGKLSLTRPLGFSHYLSYHFVTFEANNIL